MNAHALKKDQVKSTFPPSLPPLSSIPLLCYSFLSLVTCTSCFPWGFPCPQIHGVHQSSSKFQDYDNLFQRFTCKDEINKKNNSIFVQKEHLFRPWLSKYIWHSIIVVRIVPSSIYCLLLFNLWILMVLPKLMISNGTRPFICHIIYIVI